MARRELFGVEKWRRLVFAAWLGLVSLMLLMPPGYAASEFRGEGTPAPIRRFLSTAVVWAAQDGDLWHAFCFLILAVLAARLRPGRSWHSVSGLFVILNLYSLGTESAQELWIPGRAFEWSDLAFNAAGIVAGLFVGWR